MKKHKKNIKYYDVVFRFGQFLSENQVHSVENDVKRNDNFLNSRESKKFKVEDGKTYKIGILNSYIIGGIEYCSIVIDGCKNNIFDNVAYAYFQFKDSVYD